ncbi:MULTISPECIES: triose-phosphate isomerase [Dehalobacter]|jgi:triosephosphate isomerase|nr:MULTISPECIES: triose-phosphate isomerase [Dehalobacter]MDJ0305181.1 triose-phosphate isomerase [Dehalobacter sp.]OCZ53900.1 triose-phosphate isomerase [Dehalobacter sp. TeCB1]
MTRKPIIAGNWKMYKTVQEAKDFAAGLLESLEKLENGTNAEMVICAPFTALAALKDELEESIIHIGAQNMYYETQGAYTGEISPLMLTELACTYVIIGHSERREYFKEDDALIAKKVKTALDFGLTPILCVGENLALREAGQALVFVQGQVENALRELSPEEIRKIVVAYEPIWAIGTGRTASPQDAQEMCAAIRATLARLAAEAAQEIRILYGGSVKASNIAELMDQPDIDGALVGGASLDFLGFTELIGSVR